MKGADLVIVFDSEDLARKHYPALMSVRRPLLFEPLPDGIPIQLQGFAPSIVTLNGKGQITAYGEF